MRSWTICILALLFGAGCSGETIEIPKGTQLSVILDNEVRSDQSHPGDEVVATTTEPIQLRSKIVVPIGTRVRGVVTSATPASSGDPASLAIEFRQFEDDEGTTVAFETHPIRLVSRDADDARQGALAAVVDVDRGDQAAVVGGAVEPQEAILTAGQEIALRPGQRILFRLDTPVRMRAPISA